MLNNVAIVGPPNTGKTTLFNILTGGHYKTGNYPGVTVDYHFKTIEVNSDFKFNLFDSPGIHSLFPTSEDEKISVNGLFNHPHYKQPDLVISVIDATQLGRHLYLTDQLIRSGFNVLVVLTMTDLIKKKNLKIDDVKLAHKLGVPVLAIATKSKGSKSIIFSKVKSLLSELKDQRISIIPVPQSDEVINTFNKFNELTKTVYSKINNNIKDHNISHIIDNIVLNPLLGGGLFLIIMATLFTSIFWLAEPFMDYIDIGFSTLANVIATSFNHSLFGNFLAYGVIGGVGAVLIFLPQIVILFLLIGLLEDSGYLSRAAVIVDLPLTKIGLSGRSFVPMLSGFACAIPAMMSARTIKNKRERLITLFIIPLMSCSARLPVYTILLALIVPTNKPWLGGIALLILYILHLLIASIVAAIIAKTLKVDSNSQFALELPAYKLPDFRTLFFTVWNKAKAYLIDAGTIILLISVLMWTLVTFPIDSKNTGVEYSYLGKSGQLIEPILEPMGLDWRCGVAIISSFAAREVFVSSLLQVFKVSDKDNAESLRNSLLSTMKTAKNKKNELLFTTPTILGLIVFYMFALMCFPTISIAKKEFGQWKIAIYQFMSFTILAYVLSIITVQVSYYFNIY